MSIDLRHGQVTTAPSLPILHVLGLDIGGANLKASHSDGTAHSIPFQLWKNPSGLSAALRLLIECFPKSDLLAVTMTGELCDCFETKRQGVLSILESLAAAASGRTVQVWRNDGRFVELKSALADPLPVAAANWLALATYAGRFEAHGPALLVDIGSTTSDIIPLLDGKPVPHGRTDPERLKSRELVYTGARRTPVCALLDGQGASELFATTLDVHLLLGSIPENSVDTDTADGRPATIANAHARLARMICGDEEVTGHNETRELAAKVARRQFDILVQALEQVAKCLPSLPRTVILSGSGEFLGRQLLKQCQLLSAVSIHSLDELLGSQASQAACAYALAVLASETHS
jgi:(4-(4-[2-(gamma-L-glutamylamino)ethyl]phenoxymethyl)furan-2-yl)methanamine synthase